MKGNLEVYKLQNQLEELLENNPNGPYTHNIISLILRRVSRILGLEVANAWVKEYNLTELYGIRKEKGIE